MFVVHMPTVVCSGGNLIKYISLKVNEMWIFQTKLDDTGTDIEKTKVQP